LLLKGTANHQKSNGGITVIMVRVSSKDSLRQKIFDMYVANPYVTAKKICEQWFKDRGKAQDYYKKHGGYINRLLSEFRSYHILGLPQEAQRVPHRRIFVWEGVARGESLTCESLVGWVESVNRNGMWVFRDDRGTVHWYKGGLVRLYLRGAVQLARAKELFCRAFSWFSDEEFRKYLDVPLREELRHWVFEVGALMPRFDIRQFERSHGLRIFTDSSHATALEVEETQPFWIEELRETTGLMSTQIREHLNLIKEWQVEAKHARDVRSWRGWLKRFKEWLW
jgi:hypothetical protein